MAGCYVVFHKQLGDTLLLEPALSRLRDHHGGPVRLITRRGHAPLLALMNGVEAVHGYPLRPLGDLYCYDPLSKSAFRSIVTPSARKHCILPDEHEVQWFHRPLFGHRLCIPGLGDAYIARYFWEHTPVPARNEFHPPQLRRPDESGRPPEFMDAPFILINPTAGWRKKSWTPERWGEVIRYLHGKTAAHIVMTSSSIDWQIEHCQAIAALAGPLVTSLASGTTLDQFLWLCSRALLVVTVDGAASHLAAAFGVKNLTLFGPTSVDNWHHPTALSVALQASASKDGVCRLRNLPAEEVIAAAARLL